MKLLYIWAFKQLYIIEIIFIGGVLAFIPSNASAADVDCTTSSTIGNLGPFPDSLIGNCTLDSGGSTVIVGLIFSGGNNFAGYQSSATPTPTSPVDLGVIASESIIDFGTTQPDFASCIAADHSSLNSSVPAVDGNWYCVQYVASNDTGYIYGQFIDAANGFASPIPPAITPENVPVFTPFGLVAIIGGLLWFGRRRKVIKVT